MQEILKIQNLKFQYPAYPGLFFPPLFDGLNLSVSKGDFKVILGKPESGKTTLLRIMLSLIPRYTEGSISGTLEYKGESIRGFMPYELIRGIGAVFQDPDEQIITTACDSEIAFALESMGIERKEIGERVDYAFSVMNIEYLRSRNPATLSGGEKKKLLIACLFAVDPDIWVLDETIEELDPAAAESIMKNILTGSRTVILFASKMLEIFEKLNPEFYILSEGRILNAQTTGKKKFDRLLIAEGLVINPGTAIDRDTIGSRYPSLLEINDLNYRYPDNSDFALFIDQFHLGRGEIISLVGKNGSGKSTLGKVISGLKKRDSGTISIEGRNNLNKACAYMFQNPDYQIFLPTVKEELSFGHKFSDDVIEDARTKFSLPANNVPPSLMSYGARKRLQGAVYYILEKDIFILDEADSGLSLEDFSNLVSSLYKPERGILIITHNLNLSALYSNRIYIIDEGKIVKEINKDLLENMSSHFSATGPAQ